MAENDQDDSQKTEEPTQRRLDQAREKGQIAKSQEVTHWFMILAAALFIGVFGESFTKGIASSLYRFVEQPHSIRLDGGQLRDVLLETMSQLGLAVLAPVIVVMLAAFMAGFIQNGLVVSTETITPKLEKLSLIKGLKRLFSSRSLVEFAKGIDSIALRMREVAEEHGVPVVENPPLCRALYDGVDLDQEVPAEHYKAVAEIIGYIMRLKGKLRGRHGTARR